MTLLGGGGGAQQTRHFAKDRSETHSSESRFQTGGQSGIFSKLVPIQAVNIAFNANAELPVMAAFTKESNSQILPSHGNAKGLK